MDSLLSIFGGDVSYTPGEGHFARSREPAGKNTVVHAGSPGSWKATSKKLWIILSANTFSLKTVWPLEPFCSLLNCFYAVSNVNLCFCSHEIFSAPFSLQAQSADWMEKLEMKYRNHSVRREETRGRNWCFYSNVLRKIFWSAVENHTNTTRPNEVADAAKL